jgi:hypothetical protein
MGPENGVSVSIPMESDIRRPCILFEFPTGVAVGKTARLPSPVARPLANRSQREPSDRNEVSGEVQDVSGTEVLNSALLTVAWGALIALVGYRWAMKLYNRDPSR